ncbi:MAG: Sir2 family NAD-dependent protein deacetylase [Limnochordales bacterium]|nr:Sir2 family NAD-dependent protein deacetylase [Limnochordales bacterium]
MGGDGCGPGAGLRYEARRVADFLVEAASDGIIVLTGAGISTASGIPDFRSPGSGLWERIDPMEAMSLASFERDPAAFYRLALASWLPPLLGAQPNAAHLALARLEVAGLIRGVITQNIDGLHQAAGSRAVLEIHGNVQHVECRRCGYRGEAPPLGTERETELPPLCPLCHAPLKPGIVLFGEQMPPAFYEALALAQECAAMIVIGSSLQVAPAAYLPELARRLVVNNLQPTPFDTVAELVVPLPAQELWPEVVAELAERGLVSQ